MMQKFYWVCLFAFTVLAIFFAVITSSKILYTLAIILSVLCLGFFLKIFINIFPKKIHHHIATIHVILLEPVSLFFVYLLSFLSFFNKPFNSNLHKTPILFVHGYINFASVWLYHLIRLKRKGYGPLYLINLGFPFSSIESYAKKVKKKVLMIQKATKKKDIILIGHSMGGLISSYYASKYKNHANVKAIITLGSPLKGTKVAKIGIGKCCRQMQINSTFIKKTQPNYPVELLYQIVTKKDQLVIPYTSGIINQKKDRIYVIDDLGHCSLLYSTRVTNKIDHWLRKLV